MYTRRALLRVFASAAAGLQSLAGLATGAAAAETYPDRPIRVVVPFAPGGGTDILARIVAPKMAAALGQQLIVDNRPGAGGNIGVEIVARAAPDGYTLLMVDSSLAVNPSLYAKLPFDPLKDLAPVSLMTGGPVILVVHPSLPVDSVKALIALAKSKPGQLNFGSGGIGSSTELAGDLFKFAAGIDMVEIPYKGTGPALIDVVAGQTNLLFGGISSARPYVESGQLKALAVTGEHRAPALPEVPTFTEAGLPGVDSSTYWGMLAPAGTPGPIIDRLSAVTAAALKEPEIRARLVELGYDPIGGTPADYAANLQSEIAKWAAIVKRAGVKIE